MIPYATEPRDDTGVSNGTLGIWLFLASEVMLFGGLFSAYALLRSAAVNWPTGWEVLGVGFGVMNTVTLMLLTTLMWGARRRTGRSLTARLGVVTLLAVVFMVTKSMEYADDVTRQLYPSTSTFLAIYFTLTGLHAAHVAGGFLATIWTLAGRRRVGDAMTTGRVHALSLYWLFVDLVWLIMFAVLYLT